MGEWHEVLPKDPDYPCTNCQVGWGSVSQKTVRGKLYQKFDSCADDCPILKKYHKKQQKGK
jgi:hypothetical protein